MNKHKKLIKAFKRADKDLAKVHAIKDKAMGFTLLEMIHVLATELKERSELDNDTEEYNIALLNIVGALPYVSSEIKTAVKILKEYEDELKESK